MAPAEANIEMDVLARNVPNDCIDFRAARRETRALVRFYFLNINAPK
jgi:hypothetical protein